MEQECTKKTAMTTSRKLTTTSALVIALFCVGGMAKMAEAAMHLQNQNSLLYLDIPGTDNLSNVGAIQWSRDGGRDQYWRFEPTSPYPYTYGRLINNLGKCLAVYGTRVLDGSQVYQWTCGTTDNFIWRMDDRGGMLHRFINVRAKRLRVTDMCLAVAT